jgi:hypothetical protein
MRFSVTSFIRPLVCLSLAVVALAVLVGRNASQGFVARYHATPRYQAINGMIFSFAEATPRFLDRENGTLVRFQLAQGDSLEYASCSPWRNERNESQLVGRWTRRARGGTGDYCEDVGLARYSFPSGRVIDRTSLDIMPIGPICWYPGTEERILFAAGDGQLHYFRFDGRDRETIRDENGTAQPKPLRWKVPPPGEGNVLVADPVWPAHSQWKRRILVSLSYQLETSGRAVHVGPEIWWLELDKEGESIEKAGRLTIGKTDSDDGQSPVHERLPNLAATLDGRFALAYLSCPEDRRYWSLRVAPVVIEAGTGNPRLETTTIPTLDPSCAPAPPTFSPDGRWVYGMVLTEGSEPRPQRFSVVETLAALQAPRLSSRDRRGAQTRSLLNDTKVLVQLSSHFARHPGIDDKAGGYGRSHAVPLTADGPLGLPALDDHSADSRRRDARGG